MVQQQTQFTYSTENGTSEPQNRTGGSSKRKIKTIPVGNRIQRIQTSSHQPSHCTDCPTQALISYQTQKRFKRNWFKVISGTGEFCLSIRRRCTVGVKVQTHSFVISSLDRRVGLTTRFTQGKERRNQLNRRMSGPPRGAVFVFWRREKSHGYPKHPLDAIRMYPSPCRTSQRCGSTEINFLKRNGSWI